MDSDEPSSEEIERDAKDSRFAAGYFLGLGTSPLVGLTVYLVARLFFEHSLAAVVVLAGAILCFGLGLFYVALARMLEE